MEAGCWDDCELGTMAPDCAPVHGAGTAGLGTPSVVAMQAHMGMHAHLDIHGFHQCSLDVVAGTTGHRAHLQ
eukprot:1159388-Pelagomonas_calceolata.AAC.22